MKSTLLLHNIGALMQFVFAQTMQQFMVRAALLMADIWACETYLQASPEAERLLGKIRKRADCVKLLTNVSFIM